MTGIVLKDCIGKRSIGKRIFGLKVIGSTEKSLRYYQLILRNIISVIWFVEAFFLVVMDKPRLGDLIAKTKVIEH